MRVACAGGGLTMARLPASPWHIGLSSETEHYVFSAFGQRLLVVIRNAVATTPEEGHAVASVMAASAEMLEALRALVALAPPTPPDYVEKGFAAFSLFE